VRAGSSEWGVGSRGRMCCTREATARLLRSYSLLPTHYSLSTGGALTCR
jgi:hypothetical protein